MISARAVTTNRAKVRMGAFVWVGRVGVGSGSGMCGCGGFYNATAGVTGARWGVKQGWPQSVLPAWHLPYHQTDN